MNSSTRAQARYPRSSAQRLHAPTCPRCDGRIDRVPRRTADFIISLLVPVCRYRCLTHGCHWEGRLRSLGGTQARDGRANSRADGYGGRRTFL